MSAVVGNLVVNLEARTIRLEQSLNRVEAMTKRSAKTMESSFNAVKTAFAGMLSLGAVTALATKVKSALDLADEIVNTADSIGVLTSEYQKLQYLAEQAGIEQEAFNTGLERFTKTVGAASAGGKQAAGIFAGVGIAIKNADGSLRSTSDILMDAADRFNALGSEAEKAKLATDLFGRSGIRFSLLLGEGSEKIRQMADEAQRLGIVLDDSLLRKAEEAGDAINTLNRAATALINEAIITMAPEITQAASAATEMIVKVRELSATFEAGESPMLSFLGALGNYGVKVFQTVGSAIGQSAAMLDAYIHLLGNVATMDFSGAKANLSQISAIGKGYWNDLKGIWNPPAAMPEINVPEVAKSGKVGTLRLSDASAAKANAAKKKKEPKGADYSALEDVIRGLEQERKQIEALTDSYKRAHDPLFELSETQKEINMLWDKGLISAEVKMSALSEATERQKNLQNSLLMSTRQGYAGVNVAISDYLDKATNAAQQTYDIMTHTFNQLETTLSDFFTTGKLNFQDFAASIVAEMNKVLTQRLIMAPLVKSLGMSDLFNFGGARALGGPVFAGNSYLVGERGPEYFVPHVSGRIEPSGKGGEQTIQQNFTIQTPNADSFRRSQDQILQAGAQQARRSQWRNGK